MVSSTARRDDPGAPGPAQPEEVIAATQAVSSHLVESMLHDTRNPLNALAINLEVLTEKLKDDQGVVAPALEKNLRAMREQVFRVDAILRTFAEFLITQPGMLSELSLPDILERANEVLGHEARKRRVKVKLDLEPGLPLACKDPLALRFLAYQALLRALTRSSSGAAVEVSLRKAGERAVLLVRDEGGESEPDPLPRLALEALGRERAVEVSVHGGRCELRFPLG